LSGCCSEIPAVLASSEWNGLYTVVWNTGLTCHLQLCLQKWTSPWFLLLSQDLGPGSTSHSPGLAGCSSLLYLIP
jgi:hypothetical protein